ncbi:MAG: helix-turn-helix domain-containing protein [Ruminococcus sp.]|jgi:excisionase family DNA binding protein|nr:helix-turn-helix domain-containing protein [Ruminococcus sp.]MBQ4172587.1 helix-turn-helix domain-containing protein [Ruminococcus sp.]
MNYTTYEQLPLVLSIEQLMKVLSIGRNSAYDLVRCGQIQSIRVGNKIRIPKEAVVSFIQSPQD